MLPNPLTPALSPPGRGSRSHRADHLSVSSGANHSANVLTAAAVWACISWSLAIDMNWGLQTNSATANFENWMAVAEELTSRLNVSVISLYNRRLLIDEQMLAAIRGHPGILTSSGIIANPHWLPADLLNHGTLRQQIDHALLVP